MDRATTFGQIAGLLRRGTPGEASALYRKFLHAYPIMKRPPAAGGATLRVLRLVAANSVDVSVGPGPHGFAARAQGHWALDHLFPPDVALTTFHVFPETRSDDLARLAQLGSDAIVNCMADPDLQEAELAIAGACCLSAEMPVVNHPAAVLGLGADRVAAAVADVPDLVVPRVFRLSAEEVEAAQIYEPWIARRCGSDAAEATALVADQGALLRFAADHPGDVYLSEVLDFASADGLYRKYRVRVVDGEPVPEHVFIDRNTQVHPDSSRKVAAENLAFLEEERQFVSAPCAPEIDAVLRRVHERVGTDFYAVDFAMLPNDRLLLLGLGAAMQAGDTRSIVPWSKDVLRSIVGRFSTLLRRKASERVEA
jgi:hypothetical protein